MTESAVTPMESAQAFASACDRHQAGDLAAAAQLYQLTLEADPGHAGAWLHLGLIRHAQGDLPGGLALLRRSLELAPDLASAHYNLAMILRDLGRTDQALPLLQRAAALEPGWVEAWLNLGRTLMDLGHTAQALGPLQQALNLNPRMLPALALMARACGELGQNQAQEACLLEALKVEPKSADLWLNLGQTQRAMDKDGPALGAFKNAAKLDPGSALAHRNLGQLHYSQGRTGHALESLLTAARLDPEQAVAWASLGGVYWALGQADEAIAATARGLELNPHDQAMHSNLLMLMQYSPQTGAGERLDAARDWDRRHGPAASPPTPPRAKLHGRPLRLGYLSGDLHAHPVGFFLEAVLPNHDPRRVEAICLADQAWDDQFGLDLRRAASAWINVHGLSHRELAELVRAREIDILLDLAGHTAPNRLPVFAGRAAPLQATWLGYCATTAVTAMDYIIADRHIIPPAEEGQYVERVARMPHAYICLAPPQPSPEVAPLPALAGSGLTLASFNTMAKITPGVVALWGELMRSLSGSRLMLRNRQLADPAVRARYLGLFAGQGIEPHRLDLGSCDSRLQTLEAYSQADLALDPFPYGGGLTTFEALWMGLPVVAMSGDRFVGHHAETILRTAGLDRLVAPDAPGYLGIARRLAADLPGLARLRADLRRRLLASPLMDGAAFTRALEDLLEGMWEGK